MGKKEISVPAQKAVSERRIEIEGTLLNQNNVLKVDDRPANDSGWKFAGAGAFICSLFVLVLMLGFTAFLK